MEDDDVGVILPREAMYLFRRGELLGTEDVWIPLEVSLFDRFFKARKIADCHVEVGDDDQPIAAFISIARLFLEKRERFELYRSAAFSGMFPLEGISRAKKRPWSLYELFAEMIIARMLNCENVERVSDRCARLARSWLKHHQLGYEKQNMYEMNEDGMIVLNTEMEREEFLPNLVSVLDLHIMLGHAVAPNRHIGAVVIALFRGAMRAIKTGKVPGIARAPDNSLVEVEQVEMIRQSGGKCRVRATRKLKEVSVALIGMALILGAAAIMWRLDGKVEAIAMGASAVPFGIAILSIAIKIFHDRDLNDWIAGYQTVTRLSEIKRDFKGDWRRVLLKPFVERKLAPVNACLFSTELRGTIVVDDPFSVPELESMGFEFALEDSGHLGLRAPSRKFRRVVLIENGLHVTKEFCTGRMWSFRASDTPLAFHVITCASRHSGDASHGTDCGTEFELENGQLA